MSKLKEATRDQHENLEKVVNVMDNGFTADGYRRLITKFYRFYAGIEPRIAASGINATGFDLDRRRKLPLLERDMNRLGIDVDTSANTIPWQDLPELDTPAKAFGSMYVLEGATLGGQVIMRHLKQHLGIDAESGGAFFNSYGDQVGPMWKQFAGTMTEFADEYGDDATIIEAARETFDSFARCFEASESAAA